MRRAGKETLGRLFNVLGETIDKGEQLDDAEHWVIHRDPPAFDEQSPVWGRNIGNRY